MAIDAFVDRYQKERRNTESLKWDALEERFEDADLLPLWVADMEFQTPETVTNALINRIQHGVFGYSLDNADYFRSFSAWQEKRHNIHLQKEWLRFSTGVVQSLYHLIQCFSEKGDGVLIQPPVYYPFFHAVKDTERKLVVSPLKSENGQYRFDLKDFEEKLRVEKPKLFILCSPHNPVGRIWDEDELLEVLSLCKKHGVLVIADEIHQDFGVGNKKFVSTLNIADGSFHDCLILCNAPSKTFNLASLLHSHIIIPDDKLRRQFDQRIIFYQQTENNLLGQLAGQTAYETGEEWLDGLLGVIRLNYEILINRLKKFPAIIVSPLEGTYLAWIDLTTVIPRKKIKEIVQKKAQLAVDYGEWFSEECEGFIRLNLATTPTILKQAVDQLVEALESYEGDFN